METRHITEVRVIFPGTHAQHITHFQWTDQNGERWHGTREEMVKFVASHPRGAAYTFVGGVRGDLHVVQHWVETYPDATKKDNLLNLPRF